MYHLIASNHSIALASLLYVDYLHHHFCTVESNQNIDDIKAILSTAFFKHALYESTYCLGNKKQMVKLLNDTHM